MKFLSDSEKVEARLAPGFVFSLRLCFGGKKGGYLDEQHDISVSTEDTLSYAPPVFLGIDPGLAGAICTLPVAAGAGPLLYDMPVIRVGQRGEVDRRMLLAILRGVKKNFRIVGCAVEWSQPMPKQGVVSTFNYGMGFGMILMALTALDIPFEKVRPQAWKKVILAGYATPDKSVSIAVARERFPAADLGKKKDAGRAEALLIASYARR